MDKNKYIKYLVGTITAFLLTIVFQLLFAFKVIPLSGLYDWISATDNPMLTLWASSLFTASIFLTARHVGIDFWLAKYLKGITHPSFDYLFGLPWQATTSLILVSGAFLLLSRPTCEVPAVNITVDVAKNVITQEFDGTSIATKPDSIITFSAKEIGNTVIFCNWSYSGKVIDSISSKYSCTTQVYLAKESGSGILTVALSSSYCPTISTRTIEINVGP